ncbi:MAG: aminopeptidase [Tissierellia bacterium]|nr:aminopeptidase [Tissierellia bacterium]
MNLKFETRNVWQNVSDDERKEIFRYSKDYMNFLDRSKTERLAAKEIVRLAKEKGYISLEEKIEMGSIKKGDKIYYLNHEKSVVLVHIGDDLENGMRIVGAHIDSPRLDLKALPLYEDGNLALFKTHYYGGVKKYQWTCIPLALHGVIYNSKGEKMIVNIGEDENDPVFYINDLLIHLSKDQMAKTLADGISSEQLNVIAGHDAKTDDKDEKEAIKLNVLKYFNEKYGITEEDFQIAELEIVPAGKSREVGIDRSMIAAHGHDDRVCSYAALEAMLKLEQPQKTAVAIFVDKEEIGSVGNTSMSAKFFENMIAEILYLQGKKENILLRRALANSEVLSADVTVAFDPTFPEVVDQKNAAKLGCGIAISKYTGSRGKGGCNDANAEFLQTVRKIFNDNDIIWQTGELGKGDQGGGGTIAYILAELGAQVVDCGTAMHSMHAPIELLSKADAYMTSKAYYAFLK